MLVDKPTRIYHFATAGDEAADNLSTTTGFFTRLYDSFICLEEILTQHKGVWLANCPRIYGQNLFQFALMATMLGKTWTPITALIKAMWRGDWRVRVKSILLMPLLPLPLSLRRRLLLWRWRMVIAAQKRKPLP